MAENKILVIDSVEDILDDSGELVGKLVTDKAGNQVKVKKGQGGKLANRWNELLIGRAYSFTMGLFKGKYPYVEDFAEIKDVFKIEAAKAVADNQADMRLIQQREQNSSIQAQTALNRAVDLAIAQLANEGPPDIVDIDWIKDVAKEFYQFLQSLTEISERGGITKVETKRHKEIQKGKEATTRETEQLPKEETELEDSETEYYNMLAGDSETAGQLTTNELLEWVAGHMGWRSAKPARSWLVSKCKISEGKIDQNPEWVKNEVSQLQGWV